MRVRGVTWSVLACVVLASPALAQGGPPPGGEPGGPPPDPARLEQLRQEIEARFGAQVREQLGLSDEQAAKLKAMSDDYAQKRRALEADERQLRQALAGQLRPGIAANSDSVTRYVDQLTALRVRYAQTFQSEMRDLNSVLTPVQRGQYMLMRDRLMNRIRDLREMRALQEGGPGRPFPGGQGPRGGGMRRP